MLQELIISQKEKRRTEEKKQDSIYNKKIRKTGINDVNNVEKDGLVMWKD